MLVIWTGADAPQIRKVFNSVIAQDPIPHRVVPITDDTTAPPKLDEGDVLLACGAKALGLLIGAGLFPKGRTIGSCRETPRAYNGATVFVTYDPHLADKDYARFPEMQWDCQLAMRYKRTGSIKPPLGEYRWVESLHELIERIDAEYEKTQRPVGMACDTETLGLDEYWLGGYKDKEYVPPARIISISFTIEAGKSDMLYFGPDECPVQPPDDKPEDEYTYWEGLWVQLHWLMTTPKIALRGANWKYDSRWITHKWGIRCVNFRFDTLLVGTLLNENISNSLKMHAKLFTPMGGYEHDMQKHDMGRIDKVPQDELGQYMGGDTDATYRVSLHFRKELLKDRKLADFYSNLLHPSSAVFEKMERNGVLVDKPYYDQLEAEIVTEQARLINEMKKLVPRKLFYKYHDDFLNEEKNPFNKPMLMKELFFSPAGFGLTPRMYTEKAKDETIKYASTSMDHLLMFGDEPTAMAFIKTMGELNSANKTLSTYVRGFMKHLRSDGRFHPHYMLFRGDYGEDEKDSGTDTGRTSAKDPAVQTIPKHTKWTKKLRRAFIAPPGKTILQLDFSQGELKIAACLANEPTMIDAYLSGKDLHAVTGAKLAGKGFEEFMALPDDIRDEFRSSAKPANFGLLYGMGAESYMEYAFTSYGKKMTITEAVEARDAFFELYSELPEWHKTYKAMARMHGYIRSPLGRVRHLPLIASKNREVASKAERNAVNSPVQSCLSDMMQLAMVLIDREYGDAVEMFMMTHDSVALYVPVEDATIWAKRLKAVLDNLPLRKLFGWEHQLQFTSDAECSVPDDEGIISLASLKKLKNLAVA